MTAPTDMTVIAVLAVLVLIVVWRVRRALTRPLADIGGLEDLIGGHRAGEYEALARRDGIPADVADAFEQEVRIRGREMRRKDEEKRRRDFEGRFDGFPGDPL